MWWWKKQKPEPIIRRQVLPDGNRYALHPTFGWLPSPDHVMSGDDYTRAYGTTEEKMLLALTALVADIAAIKALLEQLKD